MTLLNWAPGLPFSALAHEKLSPEPTIALSDQELSDIVQGTRLDLSIWLRSVANSL